MRGQNLVKVSQTRLNVIDCPETTELGETRIRILINGIEEYDDILMLGKCETKFLVRLREHSCTSSQHLSISRHN